MLVLSRKKNERLVILDPEGRPFITITVADIRVITARIGIDAPQEYTILRDEVFEADQAAETVAEAETVH